MSAAVFLDRDGVINQAPVRDGRPFSPASLAELEILPGVPEAAALLKARGFALIVVTNQPDVARGLTARSTVEAMHGKLRQELPLDDVLCCYHDGDDCACRKPKPGLVIEAARRHAVDLAASYLVGDRWRDIEAGRRAGCRTLFLDRGYAEERPRQMDFAVGSLREAAELILSARPP